MRQIVYEHQLSSEIEGPDNEVQRGWNSKVAQGPVRTGGTARQSRVLSEKEEQQGRAGSRQKRRNSEAEQGPVRTGGTARQSGVLSE